MEHVGSTKETNRMAELAESRSVVVVVAVVVVGRCGAPERMLRSERFRASGSCIRTAPPTATGNAWPANTRTHASTRAREHLVARPVHRIAHAFGAQSECVSEMSNSLGAIALKLASRTCAVQTSFVAASSTMSVGVGGGVVEIKSRKFCTNERAAHRVECSGSW